jgi:integrase
MKAVVYPLRAGHLTVAELIDLYMGQYAGRDSSRSQRLGWWRVQIGRLTLDEVSDDHLHAALEALKDQPARYFAGRDADGRAIHKAKKRQISPATLNRYAASIGAVFTWGIKRRIAPKGWTHPGRAIERNPESSGRTRFLSNDERDRLLQACKGASWPKLYLLVLMALTTGARKGELLGMRWQDVDPAHGVVHVATTKNNDPKALPLTPPVLAELERLRDAPGALVFASPRVPAKPFGFEPMWKATLKVCAIKAFRFHDLRHSCASMLAQNGATLLEIGDLLGHRQVSMTKRYSHLAAGHRSAMVCRVMGEVQ